MYYITMNVPPLHFNIHREQGMTNKEIAADLDISEKTVEAHLSKAIKDLRSDLTTMSPLLLLWFFGDNS